MRKPDRNWGIVFWMLCTHLQTFQGGRQLVRVLGGLPSNHLK